jgi:hypothetical protein
MKNLFLSLLPVLLLGFPAPSPAQGPAEDVTGLFLEAVGNGDAVAVIEMMTEDSRTEALAAADSLRESLALMSPRSLGEFLAGFGLTAAPDEVVHWESEHCLELLLVSSGFDSTFVQAEEVEGSWRVDVKNGVFQRMLRDLELELYTAP